MAVSPHGGQPAWQLVTNQLTTVRILGLVFVLGLGLGLALWVVLVI